PESSRSHCVRERCLFFFFQAEDGIRDYKVTGVQTCALPISDLDSVAILREVRITVLSDIDIAVRFEVIELDSGDGIVVGHDLERSEERRVGKECRPRGWSDE